ncbi:uncharacterized protein LOC110861641 [Folsomia candida]|uniref:Uncharacterized protein n=1 Tax=Folsomia candida TaxID=158441 RepID=A0A226D1X9_FOLCA|nr:uncharacterized protein LOC110861641 [Folsomia candida]OXA38818.1 hypothetical protein Fcan01_26444 [Folsomia candida]
MGFHPCCGGSLQTWTKVIAILQIIKASISLFGGVILLACGGLLALAPSLAPVNVTSTITSSHHGGIVTNTSHAYLHTTLLPPISHPLDHFHFLNQSTSNTTGPDFDQNSVKVFHFLGGILIMASVFTIIEGFITLILSIILFNGASNRLVGKCRVWLIVQAIFLLPATVFYFARLTSSSSDHLTNSTGAIGLIINGYCMWVVYAFINEMRGEEAAKRMGLGQAYYGQKA